MEYFWVVKYFGGGDLCFFEDGELFNVVSDLKCMCFFWSNTISFYFSRNEI